MVPIVIELISSTYYRCFNQNAYIHVYPSNTRFAHSFYGKSMQQWRPRYACFGGHVPAVDIHIFYMQAITRAKQIFRSRSGNDTKGLKAIIEDPDFSVLNVSYAQRFFTGT